MPKDLQLSEFSLIEAMTHKFKNFHPLHTGRGDDAAVIQKPDGNYELFTTDVLVENDHFSLDWSTPQEIGMKAIEVNVSDIAAMGGKPDFILVSLVITPKTPNDWIFRLYDGIQTVCEKYNITLLGGDTAHGDIHIISPMMRGECAKKSLCLRSEAKTGDRICVTGKVGGSTAGYFALKKGFSLTPYIKKRHLTPKARLDASKVISKYANAMIDISDGVGSEARHICKQSKKGAVLYESKLPIHSEVFAMEKKLKIPKYYCALSGGEDFELLFTIPEKRISLLRKEFSDFTVIGEITENAERLILITELGEEKDIPKGYDHLQPVSW